MSRRRHLPVLLPFIPVVAAAAIISGCSSSAKAGAGAAVHSSVPSPSDAAVPTADVLFAQAAALLRSSTRVHMIGDVTVAGTGPLHVDLSYHDGDLAGTVEMQGAPVQMRVVDDVLYLNGTSAFWKANSEDKDPDFLAKIAGRWVSMPMSAISLGSDLALAKMAATMTDAKPPAAMPVTRQTRGGAPVYVARNPGPAGATFVVAARGRPYLLEMDAPANGHPVKLLLSDYGTTPDVLIPPVSFAVARAGS